MTVSIPDTILKSRLGQNPATITTDLKSSKTQPAYDAFSAYDSLQEMETQMN